METFSALLAICAGNSPAPGEFPAQRPVTRGFDVFFDLSLNKRLKCVEMEQISSPSNRFTATQNLWWLVPQTSQVNAKLDPYYFILVKS